MWLWKKVAAVIFSAYKGEQMLVKTCDKAALNQLIVYRFRGCRPCFAAAKTEEVKLKNFHPCVLNGMLEWDSRLGESFKPQTSVSNGGRPDNFPSAKAPWIDHRGSDGHRLPAVRRKPRKLLPKWTKKSLFAVRFIKTWASCSTPLARGTHFSKPSQMTSTRSQAKKGLKQGKRHQSVRLKWSNLEMNITFSCSVYRVFSTTGLQ